MALNSDKKLEKTNATTDEPLKVPVTTEQDSGQLQLAKSIINDSRLPKIDPYGTTHMGVYNKILNLYGTLGKLYGVVLKYDWIPYHNPMWYVASFFLTIYTVSMVYTVAYYLKLGQYKKIIEPFAMAGGAGSCYLKWYGLNTHWRKMWSLYFFPRKLCIENLTGCRVEIIEAGLRQTWKLTKAFAVGVTTLLVMFVAVPVYYFIVEDMWIPLIPMEIMFCDQTTLSGFLTASAVMAFVGLFGFLGTVMYACGFLMCMSNYRILVDLIGQDLADLDKMWKDSDQTTALCRYDFLFNICKKVQDLTRYLNTLQAIFQTKFYIYFLINYVAEVVCLYQIQINTWIPGYTVFLGMYLEMMFCCYIGTHLEDGNEELCDLIYATNWNTYDLKSQKIIMSLLHNCQHLQHIMLGHIGPLNVVTGMQITNSIYSLYTVMIEVF